MKTIFATLGALALAATATSAAYAGGDGFDVQQENYAVTRGDYSLRAAETAGERIVQVDPAALRREAPVDRTDTYGDAFPRSDR